jgi:hypothetical protein
MNLERRVSVEGQDVVIRQKIDLKKPYVTRDEFRSKPFQKLQKETRRCFYRSGVLIEPLKPKGALSMLEH